MKEYQIFIATSPSPAGMDQMTYLIKTYLFGTGGGFRREAIDGLSEILHEVWALKRDFASSMSVSMSVITSAPHSTCVYC
jgi:hypothetical protein